MQGLFMHGAAYGISAVTKVECVHLEARCLCIDEELVFSPVSYLFALHRLFSLASLGPPAEELPLSV
jgi:hypothetical protein